MSQAKRSNPSPSDADFERVLNALLRECTPTFVQQDAARARLLREAAGRTMLPPDKQISTFDMVREHVLHWLFGSALDRAGWRRSAYLFYGVPHHNSLDHFFSQRLITARV